MPAGSFENLVQADVTVIDPTGLGKIGGLANAFPPSLKTFIYGLTISDQIIPGDDMIRQDADQGLIGIRRIMFEPGSGKLRECS